LRSLLGTSEPRAREPVARVLCPPRRLRPSGYRAHRARHDSTRGKQRLCGTPRAPLRQRQQPPGLRRAAQHEGSRRAFPPQRAPSCQLSSQPTPGQGNRYKKSDLLSVNEKVSFPILQSHWHERPNFFPSSTPLRFFPRAQ